jgi:periplasmic glucans biosynthesis protein
MNLLRTRSGRKLVLAVVAMLLASASPAPAQGRFDLTRVAAIAEELAAKPYGGRDPTVPDWLTSLTYDQWRDIRFRPEKALWAEGKQRFTVQFFHVGLFYDRPVEIHVVDAEGVRPVPFSPAQFDYGKNDFASRVPQDAGYAGFRVHYPMNKPDYRDEVIVFLGASYFRALGKNLSFGLSARGLAIDTASSEGEEFPRFEKFWIVRPAADANELEVFALLDSESVTGGYRFVIRPGEQTVVEVESRLYPREPIEKLGIAPLTSMFFHGENTLRHFVDFRPEVHDSDGMLLAFEDGEWLWRPLDNPETLHLSSYRMPRPKGLGLLQRDRDFDHYQDIETRAESRPSAWVVPTNDWGAGSAELIEIPTKNEVNDNVVSFWVPAAKVEPGKPLAFDYDLYWFRDDRARPPGARAVATRRDSGTQPDAHRFIVDFEGGRLASFPEDTIVRGVITVDGGQEIGEELLEQHVVKNPHTGGWRLGFQVRPKSSEPVALRAFLQKGDDVLTETWSYTLRP